MMVFIDKISFFGAASISGGCSVGALNPLKARGFAEKICYEANLNFSDKFIYFVSKSEPEILNIGSMGYYQNKPGTIIRNRQPRERGGKIPSFQPELRENGQASLLFEIEDDLPLDVVHQKISETIFKVKPFGGRFDSKEIGIFIFEQADDNGFTCYDGFKEEPKNFAEIKRIFGNTSFPKMRRDLIMEYITENPDKDVVDAMLYLLSIWHVSSEKNDIVTRDYEKKAPGWLLVLPCGYNILELNDQVVGQRDIDKKHAYLEPMQTLFEAVHCSKIEDLNDVMFSKSENNDCLFWQN